MLILATIMNRLIIWLHQFISNHNVISKHKAIKQNKKIQKETKMSENKINSRKNPTVIWCLQIMAEPPPATARILDISVPGQLGTWTFRYSVLDISVLTWTSRYLVRCGTGQFGTWMRQYSVLTTIVWYLLFGNIFVLVVL